MALKSVLNKMPDKFKMKDGRIVYVDFANTDSVKSVSKEDWEEIREKLEDAAKVINSKIYDINYLRSISKTPDKRQYEKALEVVREYEMMEKTIADEKARMVEIRLKELFGNDITEFSLQVERNFGPTDFKIVVYPIEPSFDEDYDGKYDRAMKAIGDRYKIRVFMTSGVYSK